METIKGTEKEIAQLLFAIELTPGIPTFASIVQITDAKINKTSREDKKIINPYLGTEKLSKVSVLLNSDYNKAVHNQLKRENKDIDSHVKGKSTMVLEYGENNRFIGIFKGKFVIEYRPNDNVRPITNYVLNGKEVEKSSLEPFLPLPSKAKNQGTEREIMWRKLYLSNVIRLTLNGITYELIENIGKDKIGS